MLAAALVCLWAPVAHCQAQKEGSGADRTVYVVLFDSTDCAGCAPGLKAAKAAVAAEGATLVIRNGDVKQDFELFELLAERAGLEPGKLTTAPSIFVGGEYMDMKVHTQADAQALIRKYAGTGTGRFFDVTPQELAYAQTRHIERFQHFSAAIIFVAGLVDGINPCAFTSIIFFVSYLLWFGYGRRDVLYAGLFFALGLFIPYYLLGAGILAAGRSVAGLPQFRTVAFSALAVAAAVLGALSLRDAILAKRGLTAKMTLKLPRLLQKRVHEAVREGAHGGVILGAFVSGLVIAGLEAICTGQIYLPTLVYIAGLGIYKARALQYLLVYNLAFILPLLVLVGLMYGGVSSRAIVNLAQEHIAETKFASAMVFFILAVLMFLSAHPF